MASTAAQPVSKSAKKKAAKALERTASPAPSNLSGAPEKNGDEGLESPYIKELQKNIRNVNKKITNASKTDTLLAEHKGKTVDQLVAERIINNDQKAQILKKPALQEQLAQLEQQLEQYIKVDTQYRTKAAQDKAEWEKAAEKAAEKAKADAVAEAKAEFAKTQRTSMLLTSQFLRLAAYRREQELDPESDESQAVEGVLQLLYAGDESAVDATLKLVEGSEDRILSVPGEQVNTTYARVKQMTEEYSAIIIGETNAAAAAEAPAEVVTDPTVAHATTNEIESGDATQVNGNGVAPVVNSIDNAQVTNDAANTVASSHWNQEKDLSASQDSWVEIPRDPAETDTGLNATPAANSNTQSWADDHPEQTIAPAPTDPNDGFHQVQRKGPAQNNRGRGRGDWRGRGRGDRGRGRGGAPRNTGGAGRGGRRSEES